MKTTKSHKSYKSQKQKYNPTLGSSKHYLNIYSNLLVLTYGKLRSDKAETGGNEQEEDYPVIGNKKVVKL